MKSFSRYNEDSKKIIKPLLTKIRKNKLMKENPDDYKVCINLAIDNAKQRIKLLESEDRKSVLEDEYNFIKIKLFSELKKIK